MSYPLRAVNIFNEEWVGPYRGFGYLSLVSDPNDLKFGKMEPKRITVINFASFNGVVDTCTKTSIIQMGPNILNVAGLE